MPNHFGSNASIKRIPIDHCVVHFMILDSIGLGDATVNLDTGLQLRAARNNFLPQISEISFQLKKDSESGHDTI